MEFYQRAAAPSVASATRDAAARMLAHVAADLSLEHVRLAWFAASPSPLSPAEMEDPVLQALNTHHGGGEELQGRVLTTHPDVIWLRSDLTPLLAARNAAHEARHVWQAREHAWQPPAPWGSAEVYLEARSRWRNEREHDARDYERIQAGVAQQIVDEIAGGGQPAA